MSIGSRRVTQQPTVLAATRVGRGDLGASCCRSPLQYRHIAAGDPPKPASHIASVAYVPIDKIGSYYFTKRSNVVLFKVFISFMGRQQWWSRRLPMTHRSSEILFTDSVRKAQARYGSREQMERL